MTARYAIYFAPRAGTALAEFGNRWLGRDPATGETLSPGNLGDVSTEAWREAVETPGLYGFHATLKAPFRLAVGETEARLAQAIEVFATTVAPVPLGGLELAELDGFLALVPARARAGLRQLADRCVRDFDGFRAPAGAQELARRRAARLTSRQNEMLDRWGYPYVFDDFRFHMTLTERLPESRCKPIREEIGRRVNGWLGRRHRVDAISLFAQHDAGRPFRVLDRYPLGRPGD